MFLVMDAEKANIIITARIPRSQRPQQHGCTTVFFAILKVWEVHLYKRGPTQ